MKKAFVRTIFSVVFIFVQGCIQTGSLAQKGTPSPIVEISPTESLMISPSVTLTTNSPITEKVYDDANLRTNCLTQDPLLSKNNVLDGSVIFENKSIVAGKVAEGIFWFDLANNVQTRIDKAGEHLLDFKESPDRTKVAYRLVRDDALAPLGFLIIASNDFKQEKSIPWKEEWGTILGWANNSRIILQKVIDSATPTEDDKPPELIIFDITTQSKETIKPDFPELYNFHPLPYWDGYRAVIYDPDFTRAVYMRWIEPRGAVAYALWDVEKRKILTMLPVVEYPTPIWSPDGERFITTRLIDLDYRELFSVSKDGQVEQLTFLSNYNPDVEIISYSWSPNARFVALLIKQSQNTATVAVLDTKTSIVTDYCVLVTISGNGYEEIFRPLWSPNSQQIIVQDWYARDHRYIVLIDIINNYAVKIAEDVKPLVWLRNP